MLSGLLCGLVLIVPLRAVLGTTTYAGLYFWLAAGTVLAGAVGMLLRLAGVPRAGGTTAAATGIFAVAAMVALTVISMAGDPGQDTEVALVAGLSAAAFAAVGSVVLQRRIDGPEAAFAIGAVGVVLTLVAATPVADLLREARDDAADIRAFTEGGLTPYVPEIDGLETRFDGIFQARPDDGGPGYATGYSLSYQDPSAARRWDAGAIDVDVELRLVDAPACDEVPDVVTCHEGDGYVIEERDGVAEMVTAHRGDMRLRARIRDGDGELPDLDDVGRALVDAEIADWDQVVGLDT